MPAVAVNVWERASQRVIASLVIVKREAGPWQRVVYVYFAHLQAILVLKRGACPTPPSKSWPFNVPKGLLPLLEPAVTQSFSERKDARGANATKIRVRVLELRSSQHFEQGALIACQLDCKILFDTVFDLPEYQHIHQKCTIRSSKIQAPCNQQLIRPFAYSLKSPSSLMHPL